MYVKCDSIHRGLHYGVQFFWSDHVTQPGRWSKQFVVVAKIHFIFSTAAIFLLASSFWINFLVLKALL